MNDSNVPFAASRDVLFSVSYGESRRSELISQRLQSAQSSHQIKHLGHASKDALR
jgi:hypothetical protein